MYFVCDSGATLIRNFEISCIFVEFPASSKSSSSFDMGNRSSNLKTSCSDSSVMLNGVRADNFEPSVGL